jgi:hypothetical protein
MSIERCRMLLPPRCRSSKSVSPKKSLFLFVGFWVPMLRWCRELRLFGAFPDSLVLVSLMRLARCRVKPSAGFFSVNGIGWSFLRRALLHAGRGLVASLQAMCRRFRLGKAKGLARSPFALVHV